MARPIKNNADYFPHDANMRNHRKVKAIRNKFGMNGYGIWCMLVELLTSSDGNVIERSRTEYELIAGDFGASVDDVSEVIDYCLKLELLFDRDGFIHSETLDERLAPVYSKRGKRKELSKKQLRNNGKYTSENSASNEVSVTEKPQSKVKERKVNKSKEKQTKEDDPQSAVLLPFDSEKFKNSWAEWEAHRREKRNKLTPSAIKKQLKFLGGRTENEAIEIIDRSITNGWTGLFPLDVRIVNIQTPSKEKMSVEEILATIPK